MITEVVEHTLMITGFVFVMMLVIEYLNVLTHGNWETAIRRRRWSQSALAAALGAVPGCLGAFAVVSLYAHRVVTFGALVAAMIATCGDEAFVMLAMFPQQTLLIIAILFVVGTVSGIVVDWLLKGRTTSQDRHLQNYQAVHADEARCACFSAGDIVAHWRHCLPHRGILTTFLAFFLLGIVAAEIGPREWNWVRVTLLVTVSAGLFIVTTVPDHFLEEHLWNHLAKVHAWRIFLWTFGALLVMHMLLEHLPMENLIKDNRFVVLLVACLVGIIPESGPHLIFVTLYAEGALPFSILLASCIVQDGHGMIPMLAHSRRAFVATKGVNFAIGLGLGLIGLWMGW